MANKNRRYKSNPRGETTIFKDIQLDSIKEQNEQVSPLPEMREYIKMETVTLPKTIIFTPKEPDSALFSLPLSAGSLNPYDPAKDTDIIKRKKFNIKDIGGDSSKSIDRK